ncbi:MAG: ribbon-helix-helix domain-containing protein, partial [Aigarchaeota archaeon]|nr:ribbon-helix-helix domain-containing protein [Aigarchaeota archaeon]
YMAMSLCYLSMKGRKNMVIVTIHIPKIHVEAIDELVKNRIYPNRSEAIRMAIRDFIQSEHNKP